MSPRSPITSQTVRPHFDHGHLSSDFLDVQIPTKYLVVGTLSISLSCQAS